MEFVCLYVDFQTLVISAGLPGTKQWNPMISTLVRNFCETKSFMEAEQNIKARKAFPDFFKSSTEDLSHILTLRLSLKIKKTHNMSYLIVLLIKTFFLSI